MTLAFSRKLPPYIFQSLVGVVAHGFGDQLQRTYRQWWPVQKTTVSLCEILILILSFLLSLFVSSILFPLSFTPKYIHFVFDLCLPLVQPISSPDLTNLIMLLRLEYSIFPKNLKAKINKLTRLVWE